MLKSTKTIAIVALEDGSLGKGARTIRSCLSLAREMLSSERSARVDIVYTIDASPPPCGKYPVVLATQTLSARSALCELVQIWMFKMEDLVYGRAREDDFHSLKNIL